MEIEGKGDYTEMHYDENCLIGGKVRTYEIERGVCINQTLFSPRMVKAFLSAPEWVQL